MGAAPNPRTHPPKAKVMGRPLPAAQQQGEGCEDLHASCEGWKVAGECERNPSFMKLSCRRSCRLCPASLSAHRLSTLLLTVSVSSPTNVPVSRASWSSTLLVVALAL